MGWIQNKISKYVDPQVEVKSNASVKVLHQYKVGMYRVQIGLNVIEKLQIPVNEDRFFDYDFVNGDLSFLLHGSYAGKYVKIEPVRRGSLKLKVTKFTGTWAQGSLVCDEFMGTFAGGTLSGVYRRRLDADTMKSHPGVNIFGAYNHNSITEGDIDDAKSVYGHGPYNPSIYNVGTSKEVISILGLNTGQVVKVTTTEDVCEFLIKQSYKESGTHICVLDIKTGIEGVLTWEDLRGGLLHAYSRADFNAHTILEIGEQIEIPCFDIDGEVTEIEISNNTPTIEVVETASTTFEPLKLKF